MNVSINNILNLTNQPKLINHPGDGKISSFDAKPRFILRQDIDYHGKFDPTNIENYDIGIPFLIDQRLLLRHNLDLKVSLIDQNYFANNQLTGFTPNFSITLVNAILNMDLSLLVDKDNIDFVTFLKKKSELYKDEAVQNSLGQTGYENLLLLNFEAIYENNRDKFLKLYTEVKSKNVIKSQTLSLNSFLTVEKSQSLSKIESVISDVSNASDSQLFGRTYDFNLKEFLPGVNVDESNPRLFKTLIKPSKFDQVNTDSNLNGDNIDPKKIIKLMYKNLDDPAYYFKGEDIYSGLYSQINGSSIEKDNPDLSNMDVTNQKTFNNDLSDRLLDAVVNSKTRLNRTNQNIIVDPSLGSKHYDVIQSEKQELKNIRKNNIDYVHRITPSSNRIKKLYAYFNLKKSEINQSKGDKFTVDVYHGAKGKFLSHNHFFYAIHERFKKFLFEQLSEDDIQIKSFEGNDGQYTLEIENNSIFNVIINVEMLKHVDKEEKSKVVTDIKITVPPKSTEVQLISDDNIFYNSSINCFLRYSLTVDVLGTKYNIDSFRTIKLIQDNPVDSPPKCVVYAYQSTLDSGLASLNSLSALADQTPKIKISLYCDDKDFVAAKFYKRDVTYGEGIIENRRIPVNINANGSEAGFVPSRNAADFAYYRHGTIIEYSAEIMTTHGYTYHASPFRVHIESLPNSKLNIDIASNKLMLSKKKDETSFIQQIFDLIKQDGEESLYSDDLKAINQATKDILFAEVEVLKYDKVSRSFYYESIGDYESGDRLSFRSSVSEYLGTNFIKITPYQSSPILVINLVNDLISKISNDAANSGDAKEQAILLSKLKPKIDEFKNENRVNLLSKEYLQDGVIPAAENITDLLSSLEKIKKSVKLNDTRLVKSNYSGFNKYSQKKIRPITVETCSYFRTQDYRLYINFNLKMSTSNLSKIDFYVIMSEKEGIMTPVTSIKANKTDDFGFFDDTSLSYTGQINYFLVPVLMSGEFSEAIFLKSVIINEYRQL